MNKKNSLNEKKQFKRKKNSTNEQKIVQTNKKQFQ